MQKYYSGKGARYNPYDMYHIIFCPKVRRSSSWPGKLKFWMGFPGFAYYVTFDIGGTQTLFWHFVKWPQTFMKIRKFFPE